MACLLATVAVAGVVYLRVPVYYTSQTQLVVLSPAARADAGGGSVAFNPYLTAGDGPSQVMASALQRVAVSPSFEVELAELGVTTDYSVAVATSGGGVVLEVATVGLEPATTLSDLAIVSKLLNDTMVRQQLDAGSPENQLLTMRGLVGASEPSPLPGDRMKLSAIAAVLGLVLTAMVIALLAGRATRKPLPLPPASLAPAAGAGGPPDGPADRHGRRHTDQPVRRTGVDQPAHRRTGDGRSTDQPVHRRAADTGGPGAGSPGSPGSPGDTDRTVAMPRVSSDALTNGVGPAHGQAGPVWPDQPAADPGR
jgi:hypothetical protein